MDGWEEFTSRPALTHNNLQKGRHGREVLMAAHFVSVLCVVLRGRHRRRDRK